MTGPLHPSRPPAEERTPGWSIALVGLAVTVLAFAQRFGQIVYLTRLDRVLDPWRMALRDIDLWNPHWDLGALQFQTIGYWIPFDLFFGTARSLGIPTWIAERAFIAALLCVAIWGFVRLADALHIGSPPARLAGAIAYATSPVVLTRVGWQSVFAMGVVLLPWVLLPLVRASVSSVMSPRRAAARSALAVSLIGGANAAVTLAILPLPLLYLLTRRRGARRAGLIRWWFLTVPMATAWWGVGLVFYARYGPDVLAYTEQVEDTVAATPTFEVLRGTADWVLGLDAASPAGPYLADRSIGIAATAMLAGVGLAGLARRSMPNRVFLLLSLVTGVALVGGGFGGLWGNPVDGLYRTLLGGPLEAFRNVYKFQPLITLPLSLGIVETLGALGSWARRGATGARAAARAVRPRLTSVAGWCAVVLLIVAAATPLWTNRLTRGPGFTEVPDAWAAARDHLAATDGGRILIVPGIPDGDFDWGFTAQLPLQWGSDLTWATRSQAPLSGAQGLEVLDAVEQAIERGGDPGLPTFLARSGVAAVVAPNDQRSAANGAPPPESVNSALVASGLVPTASFGPRGYGFGDLHQIEVYEIPGDHRATTYPAAATSWLSGDVASTMQIADEDAGDRPYLLAQDELAGDLDPSSWIVTDGNLATTNNFGFNRNNESYVHGPNEPPYATEDPLDHTTQVLDGVRSVTASSVGPGIFVVDSPAAQPANVLDGRRSTAWQPRRVDVGGDGRWGSTDPWVEIEFDEPRRLDPLRVELLLGPLGGDTDLEITIDTDRGARSTVVDASERPQRLAVPDGPVSRVRVSIALADVLEFGDVVGIRELRMPGSPFTRRLRVPDQLADAFAAPGARDPVWVFTRLRPAAAPLVALNAEDQIRRQFDVPGPAELGLTATGAPGPGSEVVRYLGRSAHLEITADTTWGDVPALGPHRLLDGNRSTEWRSAVSTGPFRTDAAVRLQWDEPRRVDRVRLDVGDHAEPRTVTVLVGGRRFRVAPDADGWVRFPATDAAWLDLTLHYARSDDPEPIGLRELGIPAIADLVPPPVDAASSIEMPCGRGPSVTVGGQVIQFRGDVTVGDLAAGERLPLAPCGDGTVELTAGRATLDADVGPVPITVEQVVLGDADALPPSESPSRSIDISSWDPSRRVVELGAGDAAILVVNELHHPEWRATLDGTALETLRVDGWRQGFEVPAGDGGTVVLEFGPDRLFKIGTALGALALLAVAVLAIWRPRRGRDPLEPAPAGTPSPWVVAAIVVAAAVWCTGAAAIVLAPLWLVRNRRPGALPWLAVTGLSSAALMVIVGRHVFDGGWPVWGPASGPVAVLASTSLLACLASALPARREWGATRV